MRHPAAMLLDTEVPHVHNGDAATPVIQRLYRPAESAGRYRPVARLASTRATVSDQASTPVLRRLSTNSIAPPAAISPIPTATKPPTAPPVTGRPPDVGGVGAAVAGA